MSEPEGIKLCGTEGGSEGLKQGGWRRTASGVVMMEGRANGSWRREMTNGKVNWDLTDKNKKDECRWQPHKQPIRSLRNDKLQCFDFAITFKRFWKLPCAIIALFKVHFFLKHLKKQKNKIILLAPERTCTCWLVTLDQMSRCLPDQKSVFTIVPNIHRFLSSEFHPVPDWGGQFRRKRLEQPSKKILFWMEVWLLKVEFPLGVFSSVAANQLGDCRWKVCCWKILQWGRLQSHCVLCKL